MRSAGMSAQWPLLGGKADLICEAPGDRQGRVQVPCDEGVAIHIGPESCAVAREGLGEALTGERIRPAIEPRKSPILGADTVHMVEGNTSERVIASAGRPGVVKDPGMCRRSLRGNREISRSTVRQPPPVRIGKARSRSR